MVFAFDLHNVVLMPDRKRMLKTFWAARRRYGLVTLLHPIVLYMVFFILKNKAPAEPAFKNLSERYPVLVQLKLLFIEIIDCQKVELPVVQLIKQLKSQGYKVYLATNLWTSILPELERLFPDILELFDALYYPSKENGFAYKPDLAFYTLFMRHFGIHRGSDIVFIDDDKNNIRGAQRAHWQCILFINSADFQKQIRQFLTL